MLKQLMTPADPAQTPASVSRAAQLMFIGAAVSTVAFVLQLVSLGSLKSDIRSHYPKWTTAQVNQEFNTFVAVTVISSLIGIALWLTMARGTLNRHRWAQIISTVLFILYTLELIPTLSTPGTIIAVVFGVLPWLVGAGAVIMLWRPESKAYFAAR
jgi:hypothetical protein